MADDSVTVLERQPAGDLLGRVSHRKAIFHQILQVRLACQLEATIPASSALSQFLGSRGRISARPHFGGQAVTVDLPADCRDMPFKAAGDLLHRFTGCMQTINLDPLFKAELAITLSHRNNTIAGVALVL